MTALYDWEVKGMKVIRQHFTWTFAVNVKSINQLPINLTGILQMKVTDGMCRYILFVLMAVKACSAPAMAESIKLESVPYDPGMFSVFNTVAGLLYKFDNLAISGFHVDLGTTGRYYDPEKGPNWWEYFCEPIKVGDMNEYRVAPSGMCSNMAVLTDYKLSRHKVHALIVKYVHFKKPILDEVGDFTNQNFKNWHVIGIHYRGTDKYTEAPRVAYQSALKTIKVEMEKVGRDKCKIFIATDEKAFICFMKQKFPKKIIFRKVIRSLGLSPIHTQMTKPFEQGKDAILDMLLLSRCNVLVRCSSNLSLWSVFMNPEMNVIPLNKRH